MIVPYTECTYQQVLPETTAQYINSQGVGDYVDPFNFPVPQHLTPGNSRGLGCAGCGGGCGCAGLGCNCGVSGLTFDGTGLLGSGLFSGGFDVSTWGAGEVIALLFGAYIVYSLTSTTKAEFRRASKGYKRVRRKVAGE